MYYYLYVILDLFSRYVVGTEHDHSGLGWMTPHDVHFGLAEARREGRAAVLAQAYAKHPERFVRGLPMPAALPREVWINPPSKDENGSTDESRKIEIVCPGANEEAVSKAIG